MSARAVGLLLGAALDRLVPDPRRGHPVALFGSLALHLERRLNPWSSVEQRGTSAVETTAYGTAYVALLVGGTAAGGLALERLVRDRPLLQVGTTALATWAVLGGASLEREAHAVESLIDDLPAARQRLTHLVGRSTDTLEESEIARAVIESVAENTSDAVVAPLVWGAVAGIPGLLGYRAANTLDAMVGHRTAQHADFGWAAARLDDGLNLPGSRLTALLATLLGPSPAGAWRTWRRDAAAHPSPNAGPVEAAFAGALGIRLGGTNTYGSGVEHRAVMGDGRAAAASDIPWATTLARRVDLAAVLVVAGGQAAWRAARKDRTPITR